MTLNVYYDLGGKTFLQFYNYVLSLSLETQINETNKNPRTTRPARYTPAPCVDQSVFVYNMVF